MKLLKYEYINNNTGRLIIIFQGAVNIELLEEALEHKYNSGEYNRKFDIYASTYTHYRLTESKDYDFLFIQDNIKRKISWFLFDEDEFILPTLTKELDDFILEKGYIRQNVVTFGTSKGGWAARLFAYNSKNIGNIVCGVPIFQTHTFDVEGIIGKEKWKYHFSNAIYGTQERRKKTDEVIFELFSSDKIINSNINEIIMCGWKDNYFVDDILAYKNPNTKYIIEKKIIGHAPVIKENYDTLKMVLFSVFEDEIYLPNTKNFEIRQGSISAIEYFRYVKKNYTTKIKQLEGAKFNNISENFIFKDNNANRLLIIFQSAGRVPTECLEKDFPKETITHYHNKLNYYNFMEDKSYDYLYVLDNYNLSYGFYLFDNNKDIVDDIINHINNFSSKKYSNVTCFGTSKGGSAAIFVGNQIKQCDRIIAGVPLMNMHEYISKLPTHYYNKFVTSSYKKMVLENIVPYNISNLRSDCKLFIFTGVNDESILCNSFLNNNIIVFTDNDNSKKHTSIITTNMKKIEKLIFEKY